MGNYLAGILLIVVGASGFLAGVVFFILGLVRRRKRQWAIAAAGMFLSLVLGATGVIRCAWQAWRDVKSFVKRDVNAGNDKKAREWFEGATGVKLPAEANYLAGRDYSILWSEIYLKMKVPLEFQTVLDEKIGRSNEAIAEHAPDSVTKDIPDWDKAVAAEGMLYYSNVTGDANTGGFVTTIAFDPRSGIMYCKIIEYVP